MVKPEMIPEAARAAAFSASLEADSTIRNIVAAALNAWPGMERRKYFSTLSPPRAVLILPLPLKETDNAL